MSYINLNSQTILQQQHTSASTSHSSSSASAHSSMSAISHRGSARSPNGDSAPNGQQSLHQAMLDSSPPLKHNCPPSSGSTGDAPLIEGSNGIANGGSSSSCALEDDEDEEDDPDEDADIPETSGPARPSSTSTTSTPVKENLAGRTKRSHSELIGDEADTNDDEETYYPRKKPSRRLSTTDHGLLAYDLSGYTDDETMDNELALALEDDDEDELIDDDYDDHDMEHEEEEAIIRELEMDAGSVGADPDEDEEEEGDETIRAFDNFSELSADFDLGTIQLPEDPLGDPLEDLDGELFSTQWNDPHRFDDINGSYLDFAHFASDTDNDLFTADPTPQLTPHDTPRGSISLTAEQLKNLPDVFSTEETDQDEESGHDIDLTPYLEKGAAALRHFVNHEGKGRWSDETDDDADLVKYFFSSEEYDSNETDESDIDDDMSDADGDTTDEEEDLPMPTPREKSNLRRASISSNVAVRPQIISLDDDEFEGGPMLCSWVADPSKPICVIEGTKQTFLIPSVNNQFGMQGADSDCASNNFLALDESESENSNARNFDPTLTGLSELEGGVMNGADFFGPPEVFYPYIGDDAMFSDIFNDEDSTLLGDEDVDEYEAGLMLSDFLDFSSNDEAGTNGLNDNLIDGLSDGCPEEGDEEDDCMPNGDASDAMLSIWDKVSVTAFRKRQLQHNQKLVLTSNSGSPHGYGYTKGKEARLADTITPSKKRKVRQKFLSNNRGAVGSNLPQKKKFAHR